MFTYYDFHKNFPTESIVLLTQVLMRDSLVFLDDADEENATEMKRMRKNWLFVLYEFEIRKCFLVSLLIVH